MSVYARDEHGVWRALGIYESTETVRRLYQEKTGRRPSAAKAREIVSLFSQGREYFRGAAGAGELVRPLILYYGALSLARALILFLDTKKSKVAGSHGLGADGWADLNTESEKVPGLPMTVHASGTLPELWRVTNNADRTRIPAEDNPFEIDVTSKGTNPAPVGAGLTIKEALGQIPDLREV